MSKFRGPLSWPLVQLTLARLREFLREPEAIFWVFVFPLLLACALGIAFRNQAPEPLPVGVEDGAFAELRQRRALARRRRSTRGSCSVPEAERALATGKLALVVLATDPPTYWYDPTRPDSATRAARGRRGAPARRGAQRSVRAAHSRDDRARRRATSTSSSPASSA